MPKQRITTFTETSLKFSKETRLRYRTNTFPTGYLPQALAIPRDRRPIRTANYRNGTVLNSDEGNKKFLKKRPIILF